MRKIPIAEVKPNMVLSQPAADRQGRVLLSRGEVLNDKLIERLKTYGVEEVVVEGDDHSSLQDLEKESNQRSSSAANSEQIKERLNTIFSQFRNHTLMKTVKALAERALLADNRG